jgi:hypothetical protein
MNEIPKNVSESVRKRNPHLYPNHNQGIRTANTQPGPRLPLELSETAEEAHWPYAHGRFEITFTVYSLRPADYDGYYIKHLQDFLVSAGIIPGDGWDTLSGRVVSRKAATKGEERTEILIHAI